MSGGAPGTFTTCDGCDGDFMTLHLVDSFGGATLSVSLLRSRRVLTWMDQKTSICLPEADGYEITAGGGNWDGEISWTLYTYSEDFFFFFMEGALRMTTMCGECCL